MTIKIILFCVGDDENAFADAEIAGHPSVGRYETIFVRRRVKFGAAVPL